MNQIKNFGGGRLKPFDKGFRGWQKYKICYNSNMEHHNKYKKGFTLAEVLVTLGIIGVVSAMTVPTLMQNYQRKSYVTQLHKVYNELSQALLQYQTDRNAINIKEAGLISGTAIDAFMRNYFKIVLYCQELEPCFATKTEYKKLNGEYVDFSSSFSYVLASGAAIRPAYLNNGNINIVLDVNGRQGPNVWGRDIFYMFLYPNGVIDDYYRDDIQGPLTNEQRETAFSNNCNSSNDSTIGCFGKILNDNWEMTY